MRSTQRKSEKQGTPGKVTTPLSIFALDRRMLGGEGQLNLYGHEYEALGVRP
jgi:hypothetical protein